MGIDYKVGEVELSYKTYSQTKQKIRTATDVYNALRPTYRAGTINYKEYFKILFMNSNNEMLGYTQISEGGISDTIVDIRNVMQAALLTNSVAIILAHNHPSGNLKPSKCDEELTKRIKEAAKLFNITVTDHVILTDTNYFSFLEEGLL